MRALTLVLPGLEGGAWQVRRHTDRAACALADRHYSRRPSSIGSGRVGGPTRRLVLVTPCERATWVTIWPEFPQDGLHAWRCSIFRNEGAGLSSELIVAAMALTTRQWAAPPPRRLGHARRHPQGPRNEPRLLLHEGRMVARPHLHARPAPRLAHPTPGHGMKPAFSYYGGKGRLAPWIASLLPEHRVYVEPFAGSAAVLLAKRPSTHEILNDVDGNVVTFFRVLRDRPEDLERACRLTPYARDEFDAAHLVDPDLDELERARRFWIRCNQSFASTGTAGWSTSIIRGANNARSASNRVERFLSIAERLRHVTIEHRDGIEVLGRYDSIDAVAYLDPPYAASIRTSYRDGRRPGGDYAHEFAAEEDHRALAIAAAEYSGTVIISGYPSELYDELYAGWIRLERSIVRRTTNGRSGSNPKVIEALWCNRPIGDQLAFGAPGYLEVATGERL